MKVPRSEAVMAPSERALQLREGAQRGSAQDQYRLALCYYSGTDGLQENKWGGTAVHQGRQAGARCRPVQPRNFA